LKATPHCVISKPSTNGISRNTLAVFLEPNFEDIMNSPKGVDPNNVYKFDPTKQLPKIEKRWVNGQSFEEFETNTYSSNYS
jgi:isopenicillin N synthase-like dioxygenase